MVSLACVVISVLAGFGMAVALVQKKRDWPIRRYHLIIRYHLRKVHPRAPKMLSCTVCTSFWTTLIADILLFFLTGCGYWTWPLSGFIAVGFTWLVNEALEALERRSVVILRKD